MKKSSYIKTGIVSLTLMSTSCFFGSDDYKGDTVQANQEKQAAQPVMNDAINGIMNGDNLDVSNFDASDFEAANHHYNLALDADKNDSEAKFGRALTAVMAAMGDPAVEGVVDEVSGDQNPINKFDQAETTQLAKQVYQLAVTPANEFPKISQLQDSISGPLLGALDQSITDLESVVKDNDFSMELEIDGQTKKVSRVEANILLGGFRILRAQLVLVLSRNLDIDQNGSYAFMDVLAQESMDANFENGTLTQDQVAAMNHVLELLEMGGSFMTIRDGWNQRFDGILGELKKAAQNFKTASEVVPTGSDYLMNSDNFTASNSQDVQTGIDSLMKYLENPMDVTTDSGDELKVFLPALLSVRDPKALMPFYEFYSPNQMAQAESPLFFTDGQVKTGDFSSINDIEVQYSLDSERILALKEIIHFQDPTFNGLFPGMTRDRLWALIYNDEVYNESMDSYYY